MKKKYQKLLNDIEALDGEDKLLVQRLYPYELLVNGYDYSKESTRYLLSLRVSTYSFEFTYEDIFYRMSEEARELAFKMFDYRTKAIYKELSKRPHIPNKLEAKKARQERAKTKKNRGKRDR